MVVPPASPPSPPTAATAVHPAARALYSVATSFESGGTPHVVLGELLRRAATAVGARRAWLLFDPGRAASGLALAWPDPAAAPPEPGEPGTLAAPLLHAGAPIGTLVLASPAGGAFGTADRHLAMALAHPAAAVAATALRLSAAEERARRAEETAALQAELAGAVDHDLRTPLTTILGALQTLAHPEYLPADPDLAALVSSALGQAQRLRSLLGDLLLISWDASRSEALPPDALRSLITEAARAGMGDGAAIAVEMPADFPPATVDPPALRRLLSGVLRQARRRGLAVRVEVTAWEEDAVIAVSADGEGPLVPDLSERLAAAMGATLEESTGASGQAVAQLVLPGALRPAPAAPPAT
ncbi:MAG: hypothetical protein JW785_09335 [Acidimicrobiia bacterium]|nr:hypothetical protein [Acidimicrobiia bacterium]